MRTTFICLRLVGYLGVIIRVLMSAQLSVIACIVTLFISAWCIWDVWKRPDEKSAVMRKGVWAEFILIIVMGLVDRDASVYFLFLSPIARTCIHLPWWDSIIVFMAGAIMQVFLGHFHAHSPWWFIGIECLAIFFMSLYTFVMGELVRHRDKLRRVVSVATFEREQHVKDNERVRIAGHLHDVMGQYWSGVVRALDVAIATTGDMQIQFLERARTAAMEGLQEMRNTVHAWNEGRQTPQEWLEFVHTSVQRFQELTGVVVDVDFGTVAWHQFREPNKVAEAVSRTVLESLTNAVRHGLASHVSIHLRISPPERLELTVVDNGSGLQTATTHGEMEGIGLKTMRRLATEVGGNLRIQTGRNHGTQVTLVIPL